MKDPNPLRRSEILLAAEKQFVKKGFKATTLDDVIAIAGGSRRNIYAMFGNKEKLFIAAMHAAIERIFGTIYRPDWNQGDPEQVIRAMGMQLVELLNNADAAALFRAISAEAQNMPELGTALYRQGPKRAYGVLEHYLSSLMESGYLRPGDAKQLSEQLISIMRGDAFLIFIFCADEPLNEERIIYQVESAVSLLHMHRQL